MITGPRADPADEIATLETVELAAGLLAVFALVASWLYGLRMAFTTHRVYGAVYYLSGSVQQDRHLLRTDLGAGLAVVGLGTLLAALAAIVYVAVHALLTPRRAALRQAERARQARLQVEGL